MLLTVSLTAGSYLLIWLQDRRQMALFWVATAVALFCAAMIGRVFLPFLPAIVFGNSALLISYGFVWTGFRSLRKQQARPILILLPGIFWCCLCVIPQFRDNLDLRIGLIGLLITAQIALMAHEVWLIRPGATLIRGWILMLLGIQAAFMLTQSVPALLRPDIAFAPFFSIPGIIPTMLDSIAFTLLLGFSLIALNKELSDARHLDAMRNDFITGVGNRRHFEESLQRHFRRARKTGKPLSLIMIDVDEFKKYNDLYGHPAGDRCLQAMTEIFVNACRPGDIVGRYGGEEFAVLLPETHSQAAISVAERMRVQVRALRLEHARRPHGIATISLGVASLVAHADETTHDDLVEAADRALYRAKQDGRDRVCWPVQMG
jgi:diguanylate cyclase (GGDEF)-like protein